MKATIALVVVGSLAAALPAAAQQRSSSSANTAGYAGSAGTAGAARPTWQSPGEPLAAAQTTRAYVPNRDVVTAVQQRLGELGYSQNVDGEYTAQLRNNVLRFQSNTGLRPTGDVDLSTIGALGINVEPVGTAPAATAMAPAAPAVTREQTAYRGRAYDQLMERDEHMESPQTRHQSTMLENTLGITVPNRDIRIEDQLGQLPPGMPPGYPVQNLGIDVY